MAIIKGEGLAALIQEAGWEGHEQLHVTPGPAINGGAGSLDLRLGTWFTSLRPSRDTKLSVTSLAHKVCKSHYVGFGEHYYLHPGGFVLGITLEWFRFPNTLAAYVVGKSGWGRRGLVIATATGVHPGFSGCLTLELCNVGEMPIELTPGTSICQLFVHEVLPRTSSRTMSKFNGRRKPLLGKMEVDPFVTMLASEPT